MITYTLPRLPPSTNGLFIEITDSKTGKRKRIKSADYAAWRTEMGWEIKRQKVRKILTGPVTILIEMVRTNQRADLDNRIKALLDLTVEMNLIGDDRQVEELTVRWISQGPACSVTIASLLPGALALDGLPAHSRQYPRRA